VSYDLGRYGYMKLKKLEVTGFKSFYDKSNIVFPQGISAVVAKAMSLTP
jgi:hypothetical protein